MVNLKQRIKKRQALAFSLLAVGICILLVSLILFFIELTNIRNEMYRQVYKPILDTIHVDLGGYEQLRANRIGATDTQGLSRLKDEQDSLAKLINDRIDEGYNRSEQTIGKADIIGIAGRFGLLVVAFFIAQLLFKLYRYNIMMADFYTSHYDALELGKQLKPAEIRDFEKLVQSVGQRHISLETPKDPNLSLLNR